MEAELLEDKVAPHWVLPSTTVTQSYKYKGKNDCFLPHPSSRFHQTNTWCLQPEALPILSSPKWFRIRIKILENILCLYFPIEEACFVFINPWKVIYAADISIIKIQVINTYRKILFVCFIAGLRKKMAPGLALWQTESFQWQQQSCACSFPLGYSNLSSIGNICVCVNVGIPQHNLLSDLFKSGTGLKRKKVKIIRQIFILACH